MSKSSLYLTAIIIAVFAGYVLLNPGNGEPARENPWATLSNNEEAAKWQNRIERVGSAAAYQELLKEYNPLPFNLQHGAAHIMGELLYDNEGINGLVICDSSFAFGCYHSFFLKAISAEGVDMVERLDAACFEKYGPEGSGCTHGIGHGILEYLGHQNLLRALEVCEMTTQPNPMHGCTSGVFMEYNIPTLISDVDIKSSLREPNYRNLYEPCNTVVPEKFRESCHFELVEWWTKIFKDDFGKITDLCSGVKEENNRRACFLNVGNMAVSINNYEVLPVVRICEMPPSPEEKEWCREGAATRFMNTDNFKDRARDVIK